MERAYGIQHCTWFVNNGEKWQSKCMCVCVALRSEANNGWRQLDVLNTLYVLCHTACWCLSIHFPTSFQLLTLEKCAAAAADGGGGERPSRKSMRRNKKQKRDPSLHHVWNPPSAVYSLIQAQVRCRNDDDWNKRGTLQQRNSSSKLLYLWLLFCVFIFPFALTSTWHWCDAINSWEEKSQFCQANDSMIYSDSIAIQCALLSFDGNNFTIWTTWLFLASVRLFSIRLIVRWASNEWERKN